MVSLADQIELACLVEATVRKPGNVHPAASFVDLCYDDFVKAAGAVSELLAAASEIGLGESIFAAVQATRIATGTNVNLGMILLLAPLAAVPVAIRLQQGIGSILRGATVEDAEQVYAAIRLAHAGGLGTAEQQDIQAQPTVTLREAMAMAADRDRIAEQYVTDFRIVFAGRDRLVERMATGMDWSAAVIELQLWLMARWPDTLIARKCGWAVAEESADRAAAILNEFEQRGMATAKQIAEFDAWLRADGHRRNPGTTADLIAATLFATFRDTILDPPTRAQIRQMATVPT